MRLHLFEQLLINHHRLKVPPDNSLHHSEFTQPHENIQTYFFVNIHRYMDF